MCNLHIVVGLGGPRAYVALKLLDLSAVFDTIDHSILLRRLDDWFRVTEKALNGFKSHLAVRCQRFKLGDCLSSKANLTFGVPQVSVLGPLLFTLYTTPLSRMISGHAIPHHLYADDSRLYVSFESGDTDATLNSLRSCLAFIHSWISTNKLKLNPDKTAFLLIRNERQWNKYFSMFPIELFGVKPKKTKSARSLGVISDKIPPSSHIYRQSAPHAFTICRICCVFATTLIWIVQIYLQLLLCPVISIITIPFCIVSPTLTSQGFSVFRIDWLIW